MSQSMAIPSEVLANLKSPTLYVLHPPERLYRFASSSTSPFGYQASRWWLREREFDLLASRAKKNNASIGWQARIDLAVCQTWGNKMDVLVRGTVRRQVDAWMGVPKKQRETAPNGIMLTLPGCPDIQQVFIPDITDPSGM
jgi:hypothetical protein